MHSYSAHSKYDGLVGTTPHASQKHAPAAAAFTKITRTDVASHNSWYRRRHALRVPTYNSSLQFVARRLDLPERSMNATAIRFSMDGTMGTVLIPTALLNMVVGNYGIAAFSHMRSESALLILEHYFSDALDFLERYLNVKIKLADSGATQPGMPEGLEGICVFNGYRYGITFLIPPAVARQFSEGLRRLGVSPVADTALSFMMATRVGITVLTVGAISSLRLNDVILADMTLGKSCVLVVFGECFAARAQLQDGKLVFLEPPMRINQQREVFTMAEPAQVTTVNDPGDAGFNDISVKLVFELGRREINLGELKQLAPGFIFDLGRDLRTSVDIYAGQRRIGHGELVEVNETLGVRVTRLFNGE